MKELLSTAALLTISSVAVAQTKPNVIYIYADDMGIGMLSAYGQKYFSTPNIDKLVQQGTAFDNAYGCMLSAPSRASLLTGYHDCNTDKWNISNGGAFLTTATDTANISTKEAEINNNDVLLPKGDLYLPQVFKKAGYVTAQVGKLEWGFTATRSQMKKHGWDYYYGYLDHVRCHGYYPPFLFDNGEIIKIEGNTLVNCGKSIEQETEETLKERWNRNGKQVFSQDLFVNKILQFIRSHKNEPFFLYHPSQLPHGPVAIPSIHPEVASNPNLTTIEKEYASMVIKLDETVGIICDELKHLGIDKNTIIVFSSDNGHEIYYSQKGRCEKPYRNLTTGRLFDNLSDKYYSNLSGDVFNGNASMAGLKRSNLEGGVHIPMIFYAPGIVPQGVKSKTYVSNYDFLPTMADMLNVKLDSKKDGRSFLPALMNGEQKKDRYLIFGSNEGPAIITGEGWKLRYYIKTGEVELFYLPNDSQEKDDLKDSNKKRVEQLKKILLKECGGDLKNGINRYG